MAIYYVSPLGSNTSPYDTWAKAANLPSTAVTAGNGVAGPHTMYIAPGTYDDFISLTNANWVSGVIIGTNAIGSTNPASKKQVVLNVPSGQTGCNVTRNNIQIKNISITNVSTGCDALVINGGTGFLGENLAVYDCARRLLFLFSASGAVIRNSLFEGSDTPSGFGAIEIAGANASPAYLDYCIIKQSPTKLLGSDDAMAGVYVRHTSGEMNIRNCSISGTMGLATLYLNGAGTLNVVNSIVLGSLKNGAYTVRRDAGTINLTNNLFTQNYSDSHRLFLGTINTDSNNIKNSQPFFKLRPRGGIICLNTDDGNNVDYTQSVENLFRNNNVKGTYFVDSFQLNNPPENLPKMISIHNNRVMELAPHSRTHSNLTLSGDVYTITKAGATINVDRANNQIIINPGGTVNGFRTKTLATIKTELEGFGCTVGSLQGNFKDFLTGEVMAGSGGAQSSPYTPQILIDTTGATGFFKDDIVDCLTQYQSLISGYTSKVFATPYGFSNANVRTCLKNLGYWGNRDTFSLSNSYKLGSLNVYNTCFFSINVYITDGGATNEEVRTRTRAICETVAQEGWLISFLAHNTTECTFSQWEIIIDVLKEYSQDIKIMNFSEAINYIRNSGIWTTSDEITYTRTWTDSFDYRLTSNSPCRNAGLNIWSGIPNVFDYYGERITDGSGNLVVPGGVVDIGASEFYENSAFKSIWRPRRGR